MDPEKANDEELVASRAAEDVQQDNETKETTAEKQENGITADQPVSDEVVRERLLLLLNESDLATTTEKMLRKQLEEVFGVKLNDRKALIREEVLAFLEKKRKEEGVDDEEEASDDDEGDQPEPDNKQQKKRGAGLGSLLSQPMQAFLGVETLPRPQVVKAIWVYIREHNLQDPKDKRKIILDEKLSTIFTPPLDMLNMNKQLSKHCFTNDVVGGSDEPRQRPAKKQKKSAGSSKGDDGEKRKPSGFCKPIRLSDELAAVTGEKEMNRGAVMKWMYDYAKKNDLMDPSDKRYIVADSTLKKLTGESRFLAFGAQKLFSKHFLK